MSLRKEQLVRYLQEGNLVGRNAFDNNSEVSQSDLEKLEGKAFTVLPPLADGYKYVFMTLDSGRIAVVTSKV